MAAKDLKPNAHGVICIHPEDLAGTEKDVGGSRSDDWNRIIANQAINSFQGVTRISSEDLEKCAKAVVITLTDIAPRDVMEGMVAAQLIAAHNATMECFRRAALPDQPAPARHENLAQASKLSRTYATLLEALNRHRGKGQQKVTVEHVHVYQGGQAIVGAVKGGPGAQKNGRSSSCKANYRCT